MHAIVVGAGPAGLACAVCLKRAGATVDILERSGRVGDACHHHYDRLRLHTVRGRSGLPYMPMSASYDRYPTRAQMIDYLDTYARVFELSPRFHTNVQTIRPANDRWCITHNNGTETADVAIFATGLNGTSHRASFSSIETFPGRVLHSCEYQNAENFAGQRVLVVGFGNSGGDIAMDLAQAHIDVTLSQRGPVNFLPKELFGIPVTSMGALRKIMPYRWADAITAPILRAKIGRPEDYGLQAAGKGPAAQVIEDGRIPLIDVGTLGAIRDGRIRLRPAISMIDGETVRFADDSVLSFDAIILATGYRTDLRAALPETPEVLTADGRPFVSSAPGTLPGLYFCSYHASADGQLRQTGIEARAIAKHALRT